MVLRSAGAGGKSAHGSVKANFYGNFMKDVRGTKIGFLVIFVLFVFVETASHGQDGISHDVQWTSIGVAYSSGRIALTVK